MVSIYLEDLQPLLDILAGGLADRAYEFGINTDDPTSLLLQFLIEKLDGKTADHIRLPKIPPEMLADVDRDFLYTLLSREPSACFHQVMTACSTSAKILIPAEQAEDNK